MDTPPALCIFCGRDRNVTDDTCPSCGRGWVDRLVTGSAGPPATEAKAAEPAPTPPPVAQADAGAKPGAVEPETPHVTDDGSDPPTFEQNLHPPLVVPRATDLPATSPLAKEPVAGEPANEDPVTGEPAAAGGAAKDDSAPESAPDASDDPEPPPEASQAKRRERTNQLVIGAVVVAVVVGWFGVLAWITGQEEEVPSVLPTTTTADEPGQGASTTAPTVTTTAAPSTTTTSTTTTTTTIPQIDPEGEPIAAADLALGAFALGPLDFGATDGLGRLVASLGQPDRLEDAGTDLGLCAAGTGFAAGWGPLTAIFEGTVDEATLVGYRLGQDGGHAAAGLATLSGLAVGDTVADLEAVYEGFTVVYEDIDGVDTFIVVRTADDVTLLWGPLSSAEETGVVEGIHSPLPCDGGPIPTS